MILIFIVPQCPLLVAPENGMIVCSFGDDGVPTTPDDSCTFTCNDGYELLGSTLRRCQSDFTWDGEVSRCISMSLIINGIYTLHYISLEHCLVYVVYR